MGKIKNVAVIFAGLMGTGIAQVAAQAGSLKCFAPPVIKKT